MTAHSLTFRDKLRSRNVDRWHTVATTVKQNIAEHSHCLGIIAEELLTRLYTGKGKGSLEERYTLLKYAQIHDLPEIITGDMSSVFKRLLRENVTGFDAFMDAIELQMLPELQEINQTFSNYPHLKVICKAADLLEAHSYFLVAKGADEQHNAVIFEKLHKYLLEAVNKGKDIAPSLPWDCILDLKHELSNGDSLVIDFETKLNTFITA